MLVAAAVVPGAPLLVPELGRGLDADMDAVRAACAAAVEDLVAANADALFVVGADGGVRSTTFAPWGVDISVDVPEPLPLPLLVGGWLTSGRLRSFVVVEPDLTATEAAELGRELAGSADRVAVLAVGDGSARHDVKAPGYVDPRAPGFDTGIASAFALADTDALLAVDSGIATELMVSGRVAWQVLAGASTGWRPTEREARFAAPYGVGYHVVSWA